MALTKIGTLGIDDSAITATQIAVDAVGASELANDSVASANIIDGAITNADVNNTAAIATTKISGTFTSFRSTGIDDNADALAVTIDSSERVGIGTASPGKELEVVGDLRLGFGATMSNEYGKSVYFSTDVSPVDVASLRMKEHTSDNYGLELQTYSGGLATRMTVLGDGKVGIGTTSPGNYLDVRSGAGTPATPHANDVANFFKSSTMAITLGTDTAGECAVLFGDTDARHRGAVKYQHSSDAMLFDVNGSSEKLRIASAGQIGIGGANYGTSGQVLTSGGTGAAPTWAAAGGGAWELVASVTATANTSTTIGGDSSPIFSSSHDNYVLIGTMRSNQDGFTPVQIQPILAGSGTTPDTTDDISTTGPMMRSNTALGSTALTWSMQDVLTAYNVSLNYNPMGTATGEAHSFQMWFYDPFQNASFAHGQLANAMVSSWDSNNYSEVLTYGYKKPTTTAYVGLVISNNASGGVDYQLRLYGIKNS